MKRVKFEKENANIFDNGVVVLMAYQPFGVI